MVCVANSPSPNSGPFRKSLFLPRGCLCPRLALVGLGQPRNTRVMPIDQHRRDEIAAAVATYDSANPLSPLPRNTVPLLAAMFPIEDVCQRSLDDIATAGFNRKNLTTPLKRLVEAGFLSRTSGSGRVPDTYRLHLSPVRQ